MNLGVQLFFCHLEARKNGWEFFPAVSGENVAKALSPKKLFQPCLVVVQFENCRPSAAKAVTENKRVIAAVNRYATQKQEQNRVFQQAVKPCPFKATSSCTTTPLPYRLQAGRLEVVVFQGAGAEPVAAAQR